ncbi:MAG TPA: IS21 family transposase [Nitrospirae bacterium]|nr:IS21 family transposase [Nitrospirota bacterium]HEW81288.1 IS21 family transposase [Nitrospirota bacterium]
MMSSFEFIKEALMTKQNRRRVMERKIVEQLVSGKSFNGVCRDLRVGRNRVSHIREMAREYGYLDGSRPIPPYPEALFPDPVDGRSLQKSEADIELQGQQSWIEDRLLAGWQPISIYEEIPISVGRSSFYRFLHRHKLTGIGEEARRKVVGEIIHVPGEALIIDWGKLRDVIDLETGKKRILWAFVGVMGHSRYMMVRLVWTQDVTTTLTVLEDMIKELDGVPQKIVSDNPKCFALKASKYEPILNPVYERFASHYGTQIECLPPRAPKLKGKVERMMPFVRRLYQAHGQKWCGITESQDYIDKKVAIANKRIHGTTRRRPVDVFSEEKAVLKSLPAIAYEIEEFHEGKVRKDGHVRFRNKYYSVEEQYCSRTMIVIGNSKQVTIYHNGKLIEVHNRITDPYISKSTKDCHKAPWERATKEGSYYRKSAAKLGPYVEEVVVRLLSQGNGFIDTRKIWGILALDKKYTDVQINEACQKALSVEAYGYRSILTLLELEAESQKEQKPDKNAVPQKARTYKFTRPIEEYQQLLNPGGEDEHPDSQQAV